MEQKLGPSWHEILEYRHKREDESVARKFEQWKYLGCGHLRNDIVWSRMEREDA